MISRTRRHLARLGAAALLAGVATGLAGVPASAGTPAPAPGSASAGTSAPALGTGGAFLPGGMPAAVGTPAAETPAAVGTPAAGLAAAGLAAGSADLELTIGGTTLAATTSGKVVDVTVSNAGPGPATGVVVVFDLGALDTDKIEFTVPDDEACRTEGDNVSCGLIDLAPGQALDLGVEVRSRGGSGAAGSITATVAHAGTDGDETNNTATAPVTIGASGPDLYAYAPDVPFDPVAGRPGTVVPGGTAKLLYAIGNFGDVAVAGVRLTITLPRHVTFAEAEPGCRYGSGNSVATCTYADLPIVPADDDADPDDKIYSSVGFYHMIKVADRAPAPANLPGGSVSVEPIVSTGTAPTVLGRTVTELPANAEGGVAKDVDATDNTDEFVVYVARAAGGAGGGGDDGATLPLTGAPVGQIAGAGLALATAGGLLMLVTRRRVAVAHEKTSTG